MFRLVLAHASRDIRLRNISSQRERSSHYPTSKLRSCRRIEQSRTTIITNMETQRRLVCFLVSLAEYLNSCPNQVDLVINLNDWSSASPTDISFTVFELMKIVKINESRSR